MTDDIQYLIELATSTSLNEASTAVEHLEREYDYTWRPVGDRENNYGHINIGSDPGHALIERVTNSIDAVVELAAARRGVESSSEGIPATPREAVEAWFEVEAGRVRNLEIKERQELAERVVVRLLEGDSRRSPTVEIRDFGIGLLPRQFPDTILGLGGTNKIDKQYLAGAYGQGGSTALAFSPNGTTIVSRRHRAVQRDPEGRVAVTFARFRDLDPTVNKNGRYEYLVTSEGCVPAVAAEDFKSFDPGTRVVHFNMEIDRYAARLTQLTGSLWWLLQNTLFDPVLPLWAEEHRDSVLKGDSHDRRSIVGNHTRLWDDSRDRIEYYDSLVVRVPDDGGESKVRVHYWVVKERDGSSASGPIDAYVDPYSPVAYTYFGQTHGLEDRRFIRERLSLPYLTKFLIIQIELDGITAFARRDLLSTTRDRLKKSTLYDEIRERIATGLSEDRELLRINNERKEAILSQHSEGQRRKLRERFAQLMERLAAGTDAKVGGKDGGKKGRSKKDIKEYQPVEPLPTRDEPTFIRIANKQRPIPVRKHRHAILRIESDAPDGYLTSTSDAEIGLETDPEETLYMENWSDFRGGRSRIAVTPAEKCKVGDSGVIRVKLMHADGERLVSSARYELLEPREEPTAGKGGRAEVQAPEPVPIFRNQWDEFGWNANSVADVREEPDNVKIFVNMENRHLRGLLEVGNYQDRGITRMRNSYLLYTAFYAFLQYHDVKEDGLEAEGEAFERYVNQELDRAAQTVVNSISATSRL